MDLSCDIPCVGRVLKVRDYRGVGSHSDAAEFERMDFGNDTRVPVSVSSADFRTDVEAWRAVERLYRECVRLLNRYDAANGNNCGFGGRGCVRPVGIILHNFGARVVGADILLIDYYQTAD